MHMGRRHSGVDREFGVVVLPLEPRRTRLILDWSTQACVPPLPGDYEEFACRCILVAATLELGLGDLTEENLGEWMFRIYHPAHLALESPVPDPGMPPEEMENGLRRWVGLRTNQPTLPREEWLACMQGNPEDGECEACLDEQPEEE